MQPIAMCQLTANFVVFCVVVMADTYASEPTKPSAIAPASVEQRGVQLLQEKCWNCHGADKQEGGLRLDSREYALKGGERGPAIDSTRADESLLWRSVSAGGGELEMPPKNPLTATEVDLLHKWLSTGFKWTAETPATTGAAPLSAHVDQPRLGNAWEDERNPVRIKFGGERLDAWSWKPVVRAELPTAGDAAWERGPIDRWLAAAWREDGYVPAPDSVPLSLARRAALDLTGMPPDHELLEQFLSDERPDAYERYIDRLLASPRYGQHVARMWLDVVRYSDSNGFDWDEFRREAWRYRDYVVCAINRDVPFDEFVRQQLAGDEMFSGAPQTNEQQEWLLATGYLRMGPHDNAAPLFNEQDRSRAELLADLTETTSSAFLGQTFSCCRCHDHKTDPFLQEDHYRLRAFFAGVEFADDTPIDLADTQAAIRQHNAPLDQQITELDARIKELEQALKVDAEKSQTEPAVADKNDSRAHESTDEIAKAPSPSALLKSELEHSKARRKEISDKRRHFTHGLLMRDKPGESPPTFVLFQGDHRAPRHQVVPGFPSALAPGPAHLPSYRANYPDAAGAVSAAGAAGETRAASVSKDVREESSARRLGRRTALANWIASSQNPWTARVIVNRLWQLSFGEGLVATANDFGISGAAPTHPGLLDWMADDLLRADWSLKASLRQIVISSAYRQVVLPRDRDDADERIASIRYTLRRLSAEQTRDTLLASSGLIDLRCGGPPVWPELPAEILQANPAFLDDNATKTKGWYPSPPNDQYVRSLYLIQKRTVRIPFLETLDLPENSVSCARRESSIVPPQALLLLNGELAVAAAKALADRLRLEVNGDPQQAVKAAFLRVLQRLPSAREAILAESFLIDHSLEELCRSLLNTNELMFVP